MKLCLRYFGLKRDKIDGLMEAFKYINLIKNILGRLIWQLEQKTLLVLRKLILARDGNGKRKEWDAKKEKKDTWRKEQDSKATFFQKKGWSKNPKHSLWNLFFNKNCLKKTKTIVHTQPQIAYSECIILCAFFSCP